LSLRGLYKVRPAYPNQTIACEKMRGCGAFLR
jgi:hypothetical protein